MYIMAIINKFLEIYAECLNVFCLKNLIYTHSLISEFLFLVRFIHTSNGAKRVTQKKWLDYTPYETPLVSAEIRL